MSHYRFLQNLYPVNIYNHLPVLFHTICGITSGTASLNNPTVNHKLGVEALVTLAVKRDVTPCNLADAYRCLGGRAASIFRVEELSAHPFLYACIALVFAEFPICVSFLAVIFHGIVR